MDDARDCVFAALKTVVDPELGLDVVSLGLIYGVDASEREIIVRMTLTSPSCPLGEVLIGMARDALRARAGGRDVRIEVVWDPPWTPERISEEGRRALRL